MKRPSELRIEKKLWMPSPPSYGCCTRVNFVLKKHLLLQMNLSNSGLKNRSIKNYWLIFTVLKFPLGLQFSHNLTKFKIIKYISTIYIMTTTCTYLQQLTQVSDVAHGPLVSIYRFLWSAKILGRRPPPLPPLFRRPCNFTQFFKVFHADVMWTIHAVRWSTNAACNTDAGLRC